MIRVLWLVPWWDRYDGIVRATQGLSKWLRSHGIESIIWSRSRPTLPGAITGTLPDVDVVISTYDQTVPFLALERATPVAVFVHGLGSVRTVVDAKMERQIAAWLVTPGLSYGMRNEIECQPGFDPQDFECAARGSDVLAFGGSRRKGGEILADVARSMKRVRFRLVADRAGPVASLDLPNVIVHRDVANVQDVMRHCCAAIFPTLAETFCRALAESMAAGLAAVARDLPVLRRTAGGGARFVDGDDGSTWVAALRDVIDDRSANARASMAAIEAARRFKPDTDFRPLLQAIRDMAGKRSRRREPRQQYVPPGTEPALADGWSRRGIHQPRGAVDDVAKKKDKLQIGCGGCPIAGYENTDIRPSYAADRVLDARESFDGEYSEIYASHVLQVFAEEETVSILRRWRAALRPGGVLRLSVPDLRSAASSDGPIFGASTPLADGANKSKAVFWREKLVSVLSSAGFVRVRAWRTVDHDAIARACDWSSDSTSLLLQAERPLAEHRCYVPEPGDEPKRADMRSSNERVILMHMSTERRRQDGLRRSFRYLDPEMVEIPVVEFANAGGQGAIYDRLMTAIDEIDPTIVFVQLERDGVVAPLTLAHAQTKLMLRPTRARLVAWCDDARFRLSEQIPRWMLATAAVVDVFLFSNCSYAEMMSTHANAGYLADGHFPPFADVEPDGRARGKVVFIGTNYAEIDGGERARTLAAVAEAHPGKLLVGGRGWDRVQSVVERGELLGEIDDERDVAALYRGADAVISMSLHRDLRRYSSNRLALAMGAGACVLVQSFEDMQGRNVHNGRTALVWNDIGDLNRIISGIGPGWSSRTKAIRATARHLAMDRMSWQRMVEELLAIVQEDRG